MPFSEEDLVSNHRKIVQNINNSLDKKTKDLVDTQKIIELKKELSEKMEKEFNRLEKLNKDQSTNHCTDLIFNFFNAYKPPRVDSIDSIKATIIREKQEEFQQFFTYYMKKAKGPAKC